MSTTKYILMMVHQSRCWRITTKYYNICYFLKNLFYLFVFFLSVHVLCFAVVFCFIVSFVLCAVSPLFVLVSVLYPCISLCWLGSPLEILM